MNPTTTTTLTTGLTVALCLVGLVAAWLTPTGRTTRPALTTAGTLTLAVVFATITVNTAHIPTSIRTAAGLTVAAGAALVAYGIVAVHAERCRRRALTEHLDHMHDLGAALRAGAEAAGRPALPAATNWPLEPSHPSPAAITAPARSALPAGPVHVMHDEVTG
ncbi:MAG: hypothetical protein AAF467_27905 [Actinomycetota bacterium]